MFHVASQLIRQVREARGGQAVLRGQRLRLALARAAEAGERQGEETLLLLLEAMFLHLSVQTVPLLLGHATKLYRCVGDLRRAEARKGNVR